MKNICLHLIIQIALAPTAVLASEHNRPNNLTITCNANGAVVDVNDGPFRGTTYYLGKSCDAARDSAGVGSWWYAADAFIVEIDGQSVRFSNELPCQSLPYCRPN